MDRMTTTYRPQRDSQRTKVYRAEWGWRVAEGNLHGSNGNVKPTLTQARRIAADLAEKAGFNAPRVRLNGRLGKATIGRYFPGAHLIELSGKATIFTLIHELAHAAAPHMKHSAGYTETHLKLVRMHFGPEAAQRLQAAYRKHKVGTSVAAAAQRQRKAAYASSNPKASPRIGQKDYGYYLKYQRNGETYYIGYPSTARKASLTRSSYNAKVWKTRAGAQEWLHRYSALEGTLTLEGPGRIIREYSRWTLIDG